MKKSFTLIELIFVVVIIGVLSYIGMQYIPDNTLNVATQTLKQKILQKRSNALGFKADMNNNEEKTKVCITLTKEALNQEEKNEKIKFDFSKIDNISNNLPYEANNTICFDEFGRAYKKEVDNTLNNLLHEAVIITIQYKNKEQNITIFPISGYVR
ncbi:hypothetical protein JCM11957_14330 [Caminibacter profundus]